VDLQLTEKIVVVTGAASGIGAATARPLTEVGAIVVGVDRDQVDTGPPRCGAGITPGSARSNDGQMRPVDDAGSGLSGGGWWARQVCSAVPLTASAKAWGSR
jgi:NAD(P)-dependent dehydrogenase (short-subunit alcohol dehydrogenase family)